MSRIIINNIKNDFSWVSWETRLDIGTYNIHEGNTDQEEEQFHEKNRSTYLNIVRLHSKRQTWLVTKQIPTVFNETGVQWHLNSTAPQNSKNRSTIRNFIVSCPVSLPCNICCNSDHTNRRRHQNTKQLLWKWNVSTSFSQISQEMYDSRYQTSRLQQIAMHNPFSRTFPCVHPVINTKKYLLQGNWKIFQLKKN